MMKNKHLSKAVQAQISVDSEKSLNISASGIMFNSLLQIDSFHQAKFVPAAGKSSMI
jgi:hypothetical protein